MDSRSWPREKRWLTVIGAAFIFAAFGLFFTEACEPEAAYTRLPGGSGGDVGIGGQGAVPGSGGIVGPGTGGMIASTGGTGATSTGGTSTGGVAGAEGGKGGTASGGAGGQMTGSGGAAGGGGKGTGGVGTGGQAMGGGGAGGKMMGSGGAGGGGKGGSATGGAGGGGKGGSAGGGMGGAPPRVISIDFVGATVMTGGSIISTMPMGPTEIAGVKPAAHWNEAAGAASSSTLTPLVQADGTNLSGSGVTWTASTTSTSPGVYWVKMTDAPNDTRMMNGYLDPAVSTGATPTAMASINVTGLAGITGGYDVYVYFMAQLSSGTTRSHKLAIGGTSFTVSQVGPSPTTFPGFTQATNGGSTGNYVVFKNVTGTSFTLTATAVSASDNTMRAPVNGLQIVWPTGS